MTGLAAETELGGPIKGLAFTVNGGLEAGGEARSAVPDGDGAVPASARDDILLLVSELVTNAVRPAGVGPDQSLHVELRRWPRRVRVEVAHLGSGLLPRPVLPSLDAAGGWGLVLVDRIAERWGVTKRAGSICVWFELLSEA